MKGLIKDWGSLLTDRELILVLMILFLFSIICLQFEVNGRIKEENFRLREQVRTYQIIQETGRNGG